MEKVALVTTFHTASLWLAPAFIAHYKSYSDVTLFVGIHIDPASEFKERDLAAIEAILEARGLAIHVVYYDKYDPCHYHEHLEKIRASIASTHEWIVWADSDELHEFDDEISTVVARLTEGCSVALGGHFVDRLPRDLSPLAVVAQGSPWSQFPLGSNLSAKVLKAWTQKIVIARSECRIGRGNHLLLDDDGNHSARGVAGFTVPVHHFKWHAGVLDLLKYRIEPDFKARFGCWVESANALTWIHADASTEMFDCKDYRDDSAGEGPRSGNTGYDGKLPFRYALPDLLQS